MKKIIVSLLVLFTMNSLLAQSGSGTLTLTPVVFYENSSQQEIKPDVRNLLKNKLLRIVTENGFASSEINDKHIIFPDIQILTKDVVPSYPPKVSMKLEVSFYIADFDSKTIFASESFEYTGVGNNDKKAMYNALKSVKQNDRMEAFITEGKQAILDYYNQNCDIILRDAIVKSNSGREKEALMTLTRVPLESIDCYEKISDEIVTTYIKYENKECAKDLAMAQSIWSSSPDYDGAVRTQYYFAKILPGTACYDDAQKQMLDMKNTLKEKDLREWQFRMKMSDQRADMLEWIIEMYYNLETEKSRNYGKSWWN